MNNNVNIKLNLSYRMRNLQQMQRKQNQGQDIQLHEANPNQHLHPTGKVRYGISFLWLSCCWKVTTSSVQVQIQISFKYDLNPLFAR